MAKVAMEACVRDIDAWMTANMLKMNRDKTELLVLKARHRPLPPLTSISVFDEEIDLSSKARNIGVLNFRHIHVYGKPHCCYLQVSFL